MARFSVSLDEFGDVCLDCFHMSNYSINKQLLILQLCARKHLSSPYHQCQRIKDN